MRLACRILLTFGLLPLGGMALTLHVSPTGDDAWSGRLPRPDATRADGPLASLEGARQAIRRLPRPLAEPVEVRFAAGTYRLNRAVAFDAADSGEDGKPVTYAADPGAEVIISGGALLPPFSPAGPGKWELKVPPQIGRIEQLWVGDRRATRARTRAPGTHFLLGVESETLVSKEKEPPVFEQRLRLARNELAAFAGASAEETRDAVLTFYHKWDTTRRRAESVDTAQGCLVIRGRALKANTRFDHLTGVVVENLPSLLDEPGEWFLSRLGVLSYLPRPGETPDLRATYPVADKLLTLNGSAKAPVRRIAFRGLKFRHAKGVASFDVAEPNQAAVGTVDGVITLEHARQVSFTGCELSRFGSYGFALGAGCREINIEQCLVTDMGAGGVKIGTRDDQPPENHASHNRIHNNIIRDGGLFFPCAVGIWIGSSSDNEVTHNEVSDLLYSAISVGWRWGYAPSNAKRNRIEWNHLHHLGRGLLSDLGGVYTLGPSEGTSVSHNHVHDVMCLDYGGWGLYADEGSTGVTFEGNIVHDTTDGGFHQHYGRDNLVRNNVLAFADEHQVRRSRDEPHRSFVFEKNIVVFDRGELFGYLWEGDTSRFLLKDNLYWDTSGRKVTFPKGQTLAAWQKNGQDAGSLVCDPGFVDAASRDFRLRPDSPALRLGILSLDRSRMGVIGDDWRRLADTFDRPAKSTRPARPQRPAVDIRQDFEGAIRDVRAPFPYAQGVTSASSSTTGKARQPLGDALMLSSAQKKQGAQSLLFRDAAGLPAKYLPMLVFNPGHKTGVSTVSFELFLEPKAAFTHEWRNQAKPYATGPAFWIVDGKLGGPKALSTDIPTRQWVRFEVAATIGDQTPARWSLRVTPAGSPTKEFRDLPFRDPKMTTLDWVGFISDANGPAEFYLDDLAITTTDPTR